MAYSLDKMSKPQKRQIDVSASTVEGALPWENTDLAQSLAEAEKQISPTTEEEPQEVCQERGSPSDHQGRHEAESKLTQDLSKLTQTAPQTDTEPESKLTQDLSKLTQTAPQTDTDGSVSVNNGDCVSLESDSCQFNQDSKLTQNGSVSVNNGDCVSLDNTQPRTVRAPPTHPITCLARSPQQLNLLTYIASVQRSTGLGCTHRMKKSDLAKGAKIPQGSVNTQLHRLYKMGYLERLDTKRGRYGGGTVLQIRSAVLDALDARQKHQDTKPKLTQQTDTDASSGSFKNTTRTTTVAAQKAIAQQIDVLSQRLRLEESFGIASGDLLPVWKLGLFDDDFESFALSVEHAAFYLRTPAAKGIKAPKNWLIGQLRSGYYGRPANFKSWAEQQAERKLEEIEQHRQRLKNLERKQFETDFDVWLLEQTDDERRELLKGSFFTDPNSEAAKAYLRQKFCEMTNQRDPCADEEDGQDQR